MSDLKAGYGERIITPHIGIELSGYGYYLNRRAESVLDDLKVRVLFLSKGSKRVALISCDLLGFAVEFTDTVRKQIALEHNMACRNIVIACSHTHTGPASQPLRGLGTPEPSYLTKVAAAILQAVKCAAADQKDANLKCRVETIEPIGFNRRKMNFESIDPLLKIAVFQREKEKIYLLNYACHPVTLGKSTAISADWPGALIKSMEKRSNRAIFFQGFCGDIEPVSNLNRWGQGTKDTISSYGDRLCKHVQTAERYAEHVDVASIETVEKRINLPLQVPQLSEINHEKQAWLEKAEGNRSFEKFIEEWAKEAEAKHDALTNHPRIEHVPVHGISIGALKILCGPGEVFCEYGLCQSKNHPLLFTFGYADGNIGYIPTKDAYKITNDYACYQAPKFYHVYPFSHEIESVVSKEFEKILIDISQCSG